MSITSIRHLHKLTTKYLDGVQTFLTNISLDGVPFAFFPTSLFTCPQFIFAWNKILSLIKVKLSRKNTAASVSRLLITNDFTLPWCVCANCFSQQLTGHFSCQIPGRIESRVGGTKIFCNILTKYFAIS